MEQHITLPWTPCTETTTGGTTHYTSLDTLYRDNHRWNNTLHFLGHPVQRQPQVEQHITLPWTPCTETTTGGTTHYTSLDTLYRDNHMEQHITLPWTPCTETTTGGTTHYTSLDTLYRDNHRWNNTLHFLAEIPQTNVGLYSVLHRSWILLDAKLECNTTSRWCKRFCTFPSALVFTLSMLLERSLMTVHNIKPLVWQRT